MSPVLLVAPDKFRGTLSAPEVVRAVADAAAPLGWEVVALPMADGGEGMLDAFGGSNRTSTVTGPDGTPVHAAWRLDGDTAVLECSAASGLVLAGGSATTDGGLGAVEAVLARLAGRRPADLGVDLVGACDVQTLFTDAARVFGPQKGASPAQVLELTDRLATLQDRYAVQHAVDLSAVPGGGAAGGLGGGLVALGARLVPGLQLVAEQVGLADAMARADAVLTGEGALDAESFNGKAVGGVAEEAQRHGIRPLVVAGTVRPDAPADRLAGLEVVDLSATYGPDASWERTAWCIGEAVRTRLGAPPA
ncbi:glycerate kinase [Ornithinimicrobium avium]|uniref:Glycerate kinase n=1 Tax=Ornithinimicrobium avium TaxID=2283195 RepID=A0A345NMR3_9MICO|nr:glycerate kinase [Ornithinimicrobium avium]AXH96321.1 glycerate kinase [Ornithinimicrobium avium]